MSGEIPRIPSETHMGDLHGRYKWKKVERPHPWRPKEPGEELVGFYGGKTLRSGKFGQYEVVIVHVPCSGTLMLSGIQIIQLVDAACIEVGWPIRIVWKGLEELGEGDIEGEAKRMKTFEVYVAEGDPLAVGDLPKVIGVDA
jgi:hypothetical protein